VQNLNNNKKVKICALESWQKRVKKKSKELRVVNVLGKRSLR
jgi:hypothetical protein